MGTEKIVVNKMMVPGTDKRLYSISLNCGGIVNGLVPDGRAVVQKAREECQQYKDQFHVKIPGNTLADRVALKFQMSTIYASYRPIGTSMIFGIHDMYKGLQLYMIEPSGSCFQYYGCASGRGRQMARNEIEKVGFKDKSVEEALPIVAKILLKCQEEMKDKKQELELSILSEGTGYKHKILGREQVEGLTAAALAEIQGEDVEMA